MFAIIIGLIVIALVVTLLLKGYYPQAILFMGGVLLLTCTAIFGWGDLLNAKQTTNFIGFDIFKVFSTGFSSRIAGFRPHPDGYWRFLPLHGARGSLSRPVLGF